MNRYVVVAESKKMLLVSFLNVQYEHDCYMYVTALYKQKEWGTPVINTPIPIVDAEKLNLASNDDEVCQYLGIDTPELTFNEMSFK